MSDPTPTHTYDLKDGTAPTPHGVHQPRTLAHTATTGADIDLFMMTEIGDGVFVQWSECRACHKKVAACTCPTGPQEPSYMGPWRAKRFERDMAARPEPTYDLLPKILSWVRERGYTVTKKGKQEDFEKIEPERFIDPKTTDQEQLTADLEAAQPEAEPEQPDTTEQVDAGLDNALEKVRATRDVSDIPVDF